MVLSISYAIRKEVDQDQNTEDMKTDFFKVENELHF